MKICVFCGSGSGKRTIFSEAAVNTGMSMVAGDHSLVYGGGRVGLMGTIADTVISTGGHVVGVMPRQLVDREIAHDSLNELIVVESMHERKQAMADLSDAFLALPGGAGTLEEIFE